MICAKSIEEFITISHFTRIKINHRIILSIKTRMKIISKNKLLFNYYKIYKKFSIIKKDIFNYFWNFDLPLSLVDTEAT